MKCSRLIIAICLLAGITAFTSAADLDKNGTPHPHGITPDGLGTAVTFQDSTYDIIGGTQAGSNLFHSFGRFSVHSGETAVFHDAGTENTIGRVTGGEYSWINGTLESSAGNLYLLNPAGVMFGSNATLDLQGSFHVSTANYLRLGENERFYAEPLTGENLSVSAPAAFGFLDDAPGKISAEESFLQVPMGKTLSLTGGDIHLHDTTLFASGGRIHLASGPLPGKCGSVRTAWR